MTRTVGDPIEELRAAMAGVVFTPEDPDYDQARLLWNADADRRPAAVARCSSTADVVAALRYAQAEGWRSRSGAGRTARRGRAEWTAAWSSSSVACGRSPSTLSGSAPGRAAER